MLSVCMIVSLCSTLVPNWKKVCAMIIKTASHTDAQSNADVWNKICCKNIPSMNTKSMQSERITESQISHNHNKKSSLATIAIGAAAAAPVCVIPAEQSMLVCVCVERVGTPF